jgi:hypothetical protein
MPVKPYVEVTLPVQFRGVGIQIFKWEGMVNGDTGTPLNVPIYSDKTVHVFGTFGAAGEVLIQGTLETIAAPTSWVTLDDIFGTTLSILIAKAKTIEQNVYYIRPNVTAGDGTTDLDVYIHLSNVGVGSKQVVW